MGLGGILGGLLGLGAKEPKVSAAPVEALDEDKKKAKAVRTALLETEGQIRGQELSTDQVGKRNTLLGN
jgi:hypothetical protein